MKGTGRYAEIRVVKFGRLAMLTAFCLLLFGLHAESRAVTKEEIRQAEKVASAAARDAAAADRELARAQRELNGFQGRIAAERKALAALKAELVALPKDEGTKKGLFGFGKPKRSRLVEDISETNAELQGLLSQQVKAEKRVAQATTQAQSARARAAQAEQQAAGLSSAMAAGKPTPAVTEPVPPPAPMPAPKPAPAVAQKPAPAAAPPAQAKAPKKQLKLPWTGLFCSPDAPPEGPAKPKPQRPVVAKPPTVSDPIPWVEPVPETKPPVLVGPKTITPSEPETSAVPDTGKLAEKIQFDVAMVSGDKEAVEELAVWKEWAYHTAFNPVTRAEVQQFHGRLMEALQKEGYVFAKVIFPTRIWPTGIFLAKVDCGPLGDVIVKGNKHYSAQQIVDNLAKAQDRNFNYARFYQDLYDLNAKPDISVNTKLKPVILDGRRVINAEVQVEDNLPIHGAFEVANTGTSFTNDWRFHTTLQHVNVTKRDDVLTVDWVTSPDIGDVNAYSGGYFLPIGDDWSLNLYGGYSDSSIDDVIPYLDIRGEGYFAGGQVTKTLSQDDFHRTQLSLGWLWQTTKDWQEIGGLALQDREVTVSMPTLTYGYASRKFDALGGRNFFSNTVMANFGGRFGSSANEVFNAEGTGNAEGTFVIDRFQFARFQRLFATDDDPGRWSLYMRIDGQLASDPLIAAMRKSIGGADSVRGYREQDVSGDHAVVGSLELRAPLFTNFIPGLEKSEEFLEANPDAWQQHRLQFLLFTDYGYVKLDDALPGESPDEELWSAGAGLRLGLTKWSQLRLDWGYPFAKTEESNGSRGHFSLQMQF